MGNTFGTTSQQFPLIDSRCIREHRKRFRREAIPELEKANSYYSLGGSWPDVGWILLDRKSYNQLNSYSTSLRLVIDDYVNSPVTISNLTIVQARCVTRGLAADPNAIYLVQVTNSIGVLYNQWFQYPVNAQYNVRSPAYPDEYYTATLNSGTAWTWSTMLSDLWEKVPTLLGDYPGLPSTPTSTPDNFVFIGVPLWEAINDILDRLGFNTAGNYPNMTIVAPGATDSSFSTLQTRYDKYLEDDMEYIDTGSGRVPSVVTVFFHRRNEVYGSEETVRRDSLQWQTTPVYSVNVAAPATFTSAAGRAFIWDSFTVRYDEDGFPLAEDTGLASTIATERVTQFFRTIYRGTQGMMKKTYAGALPFTTGSLVDGVRWYNSGMLGKDDDYAGWRTEIVRGYLWPEVTFLPHAKGLTGPTYE